MSQRPRNEPKTSQTTKRKMKRKRRLSRTSLRYALYRLQQRVAITTQEARALWVVLALLFLGIVVSEVQKRRPAFSSDIYAESDSLFLSATAAMKAREQAASGNSISGDPGPFVTADSTNQVPADSLLQIFIPDFPVNINTATQAQLERLPRIGPSMAGRILDYRKQHGLFKSKQDLKRVRGIGEKTYAQLADKISIR